MRLPELFTAAALIASAAPAWATAPSPTTITLEPWRTRWVMPATIAGKPGRYMFDTGAGLTLVSNATLKRAGCVPWGRTTGFNMMGEKGQGPRCEGIALSAGGVSLEPPSLGPIEMGELNPKDAALDGIIGLNLFENSTITIDFAAGVLTLETPESAAVRTASMTPLPVRLKREVDGLALAVMAVVPSAKGKLHFELDSGNGGTILASKPIAELVGLDPAKEGKQHADFAVVGDIRATTDDAFTPDMIMDGNLGMPFLRNWVVTMDLKEGRAWLGKPAHPLAPAAPLPVTPA
jgi:hypothetical protein